MDSSQEISPEVLKGFTNELLKHPPVVLHFQALDFWAFIGLIQLSSRHPGTHNVMGERVFQTVKKLIKEMQLSTEAKEYLDKGWDKEYDIAIPSNSRMITVGKDDFIALRLALEFASGVASVASSSDIEEIKAQVNIKTTEYLESMTNEDKDKILNLYYEGRISE